MTGGAKNFDLASEAQDKILKGMMEGTRELTPWFITGGTNSGIMKYVGQARARCVCVSWMYVCVCVYHGCVCVCVS